jgi:hypothetical protein
MKSFGKERKLMPLLGNKPKWYIIATHAMEGVTTLTLGSRLRQGLAKVRDKKEAWEAHLILPRM